MGRNNPAKVVTSATGNNGGGGTSMTITMPSGIQKGDILLLLIGGWSSAASATGWTNIAVSGECQVLYRVADGTEGASVTASSGGSGTCNYIALRCNNTSADMRSSGNVSWYHASGTGTVITPTDVLPSWGSDQQVLVITFAVPRGAFTVSAWPAGAMGNFGPLTDGWPLIGSWSWISGKDLQPGSYTISASQTWDCITLALH